MDSKRKKRIKKTYKNTKANVLCQEPEVFVLPPDILQKLGIDLEKVDSNKKKLSTEPSVSEISSSKKVNNSKNAIIAEEPQEPQDNDASLMKTAELMKNSVFLSPTFAQVTTSTSELELLALNSKTIEPPLISCESIHNDVKYSDKPPGDEINNAQDYLSVTSNLAFSTNRGVSDNSPVKKNVNVEIPTTELPEELETMRTDDHLDEAYLSDCSNSNLEPVENNVIQTPINPKKITIISEEILSPYSVDYSKTKNSDKSNLLSFACPLNIGSSISRPILRNHLPAIQHNVVNLSIKSSILPVHCYQSKTRKDKRNTEEAEAHNDCLSDSIDISVTDIEEHLKENEEVLQEFANEIISNDSCDIINKIERSEKLSENSNIKDIINSVDRNTISVSQYENDQLFENGNIYYYNNSNSDTPSREMLDNTISSESNDLLTSLKYTTENNKISFISNCEETSVIGRKLDLDNKAENSTDITSTQSINMISLPLSNVIVSSMSDTNKKDAEKENSTNNLQDKVEEISKYLKQCLNKVKIKSLTNAIENKQSYPRMLKQKDLKSNQGVEKPGGNQHIQQHIIQKKPMKTYGKVTKIDVAKATFPTHTSDPKYNNLDQSSTLLSTEVNANTLSKNTTLHKQFCLCADFGRMAFYDSDIPYKHIHFWEQKVSNIVPNLVFSVFNEDADCNIPNFNKCSPNVANFEEDDTFEMDLGKFNICWNSIESGNEICNIKQCINNLEKNQREIFSADQSDKRQVSFTTYNKCEVDNGNKQQHFTKYEKADYVENNMSISAKIETNMEANVVDNILEKAVEQPQIEENRSTIDESSIVWATANNSTNQNEEVTEDEIVVIQIQENLECTLAEEAEIVSKDISVNKEEAHSSIKDKTKTSNNQVQKLQRFIFDKEISNDQDKSFGLIEDDPTKMPESKNNKIKLLQKISKLTRKSRQFTFEDEIEGDLEQLPKSGKKRRTSSMQVGSDEEPLSVKKSRKQESLNNESLESSNVSRNNVQVAVSKGGTEEHKVQCGVCNKVVNESDWFQHIGKEHSYAAWKLGDPAVDMNNQEEFETHLKEFVKQTGGLICSKCGLTRKYVKPYLKHFNQCDGDINLTIKSENVSSNFHQNADDISTYNEELIKCGVCNEDVQSQNWIKHIQMAHNYLAWKQGETLDLDDPVAVKDHLVSILKNEGYLICSKCGMQRKYIKLYLDHIKVCSSEDTEENYDVTTTANEGALVCAVCGKGVDSKKWNDHNMKKHYNLAWIRGYPPVVPTSLNIVEKLLKEYKNKYKQLVCNICRISRVSYMGFYAHILVCGKSEEEIEKFKILCNICNKKYIFLYKNQHIMSHREQENAKQRKIQKEIKKATQMENDPQEAPSGRRKAAEKARTVIEKYNEDTTATYKCDKCSFSSDLKKDFHKHECGIGADDAESDAELSAASESEDSYDDVDSNVSDEEEEKISMKKGKKDTVQSSVAKAKVLPFVAIRPKEYVAKSGAEFYKTYLSSEGLFPEWRNMACEEVSEQDITSYMPPLQESCKVRISNAKHDGEWKSYKRFEAMKDKDATALFVGASIQSASWAPPRAEDLAASREESAFLAVSAHRGADAPRFSANETQAHPALIQIWDFGNFKTVPKFVLGLVHDYGTVWSMDWCPSGARDAPGSGSARLGLLATACSDGIVHIYSVPYPLSSEDSNKLFYRINPVAELRISSTSYRKLYQATAVRWCRQIGHAVIFVGYSDGTTAFYDLNTDSPLLRTTENGVTVLYPYYDERAHTSCVTGVSTFPCGARAGASVSSAPSGVRVTSSPAARARRRATHHAANAADFEPLFPHAIFATDSSTSVAASPAELDWAGAGRRLGALGALAACARCGRCLAYAAPLLRALAPHPAHRDTKQQFFGTLDMISVGKKRKKPLKDDNLATIVEPTTYEEAIKKYGVELRIDKNLKPVNSRQRDMFAERFPLCNPASMAFCPAPAHHDWVVIATHSGVIFVTIASNKF